MPFQVDNSVLVSSANLAVLRAWLDSCFCFKYHPGENCYYLFCLRKQNIAFTFTSNSSHGRSVIHDSWNVRRRTTLCLACVQALLFGQAKWASPECASEGLRKRELSTLNFQLSLINFHFHPGNPGTLQSVKTVTANVPEIRKVTTAYQV